MILNSVNNPLGNSTTRTPGIPSDSRSLQRIEAPIIQGEEALEQSRIEGLGFRVWGSPLYWNNGKENGNY